MVREWKKPGEDDSAKRGRMPELPKFGGFGRKRKSKAGEQAPKTAAESIPSPEVESTHQPVREAAVDQRPGNVESASPAETPAPVEPELKPEPPAAPIPKPIRATGSRPASTHEAEPVTDAVVVPQEVHEPGQVHEPETVDHAAVTAEFEPVGTPAGGPTVEAEKPEAAAVDVETPASTRPRWSDQRGKRWTRHKDPAKKRMLPSERRAAEAAAVAAAAAATSAPSVAPVAPDPAQSPSSATPGATAPAGRRAPSAPAADEKRSRTPWKPKSEKPKRQVVVERKARKRPRRRVNRWSPEVRTFVFMATMVVVAVAFASLAAMFYLGSKVAADSGCGSCHAMKPYTTAHRSSGHEGVACSACHSREGFFSTFADGARMGGWYVDSLLGKKPSRVKISDDGCRRCHRTLLSRTVDGPTVRVRHADFADEDCVTRCHSGVAHKAKGRWYMGPQMGDCLQCHRASSAQMETCEECHPKRLGQAARPQGVSSWRSTHGTGWKTTHGAGDLQECRVCHSPTDCARCHGLPLPHPEIWPRAHGHGLTAKMRKTCTTCHASDWCRDCHGVDMPHPKGFLPLHGAEADKKGTDTCYKCHHERGCAVCHFQSSHPNVPGVGMHDGLKEVLGSE